MLLLVACVLVMLRVDASNRTSSLSLTRACCDNCFVAASDVAGVAAQTATDPEGLYAHLGLQHLCQNASLFDIKVRAWLWQCGNRNPGGIRVSVCLCLCVSLCVSVCLVVSLCASLCLVVSLC